MIKQKAIVTRTQNGHAWVKAKETGACAGCLHQDDCPTTMFAEIVPKRELEILWNDSIDVGEEVIVSLDDSHFLLGSFLIYLLPLLIMLTSTIIAEALLSGSNYENWLIPITLISLLGGFLLTKPLISKSRINPNIGY